MKKSRLALALAAVAAMAFVGCSSSTEPSSTPTTTMVHPGPGSTFAFHVITADNDNNTTSQSDYTEAVVDTGLTKAGLSGATLVVPGAIGADSSWFVLKANGDILEYIPDQTGMGGPGQWLTLPFSGGVGDSIGTVDNDMVTPSGLPYHLTVSIKTAADAPDSTTLNGTAYATKEATMEMDMTITMAGQQFQGVMYQYLSYAPKIGNIVKDWQPTYIAPGQTTYTDSRADILTGFTLK